MNKYRLRELIPLPNGKIGKITDILPFNGATRKGYKEMYNYIIDGEAVYENVITGKIISEELIDTFLERYKTDYLSRMKQLRQIYN